MMDIEIMPTHPIFDLFNDIHNERISLDESKIKLREILSANINNINSIIDNKYVEGDTILIFAVRYRLDPSIIDILLKPEYGIDVNKGTKYGIKPLNTVLLGYIYGFNKYNAKNDQIDYNYHATIMLLQQPSIDVNCRNKHGMTPLCYLFLFIDRIFFHTCATLAKSSEKIPQILYILHELLKRGADPNIDFVPLIETRNALSYFYKTVVGTVTSNTHTIQIYLLEEIIYLLMYYGQNLNKKVYYAEQNMTIWKMIVESENEIVKNALLKYSKKNESVSKIILSNYKNLPNEIVVQILSNIFSVGKI